MPGRTHAAAVPGRTRWLTLTAMALAAGCAGAGAGSAGPGAGAAPVARLLGAGVISTPGTDALQPSLSADGRTLWFTRREAGGRFTIHYAERSPDGAWREPRVAPFSGRFSDQEPSLSRDGRRLYFTSDRPVAGGTTSRGREAWVVERSGDGWGAPRRLEHPLRLDPPAGAQVGRFWGQARGPVEGPDGALYFWAERPDALGHTDLYRAPVQADGFGEPMNLGEPLNSVRYETSLAFSPDGQWVVFGRDEDADGFGLGDLYVARRSARGWSDVRNLGPAVNSAAFDSSPAFTPDGRQLLFSSNRGEGGTHAIYIVDFRPPL